MILYPDMNRPVIISKLDLFPLDGIILYIKLPYLT